MNELKQAEEFRRILTNYKISDIGKLHLQDVHLVLLAAPTSSGRNTIIRELLMTGQYHYVVSDTTRQPRVNDGVPEQNGVEYWFRTEDEVLEDLKGGKFLEAAIIHNQQVSGISLRELETTKKHNKIAITEVEIAGVDNIVSAKPDTVAIFVIPPSFDIWQQRLRARGEMHQTEYRNRLESAVREFEHALANKYYHIVVNDDLPGAVTAVDRLAHGAEDNQHQQKNRTILQELHDATAKHLSQFAG